MEPIFADGFILTLNADRLIEKTGQWENFLTARTIYLDGPFEICLKLLQSIREEKCDVFAGIRVQSFKEAAEAVKAGASFLCPVSEVKESCPEWSSLCKYVFPVCFGTEEAGELTAAGYRTIWLESTGAAETLDTLWQLRASVPETSFICGGAFDGKGIAELTPFYTVRAVCTQAADTQKEAEQIEKEARKAVLGFEFAHLGVNTDSEQDAQNLAETFAGLFGFPTWDNGNSVYTSDRIECMKFQQLGRFGHIAIRSNSVERAKEYLSAKGLTPIDETSKYRDGRLHNIYFKEEFGGFSIHLLQKKPADPC